VNQVATQAIYFDKTGIIVDTVPSFMGPCLLIRNQHSGKNVEIMLMQFKAMLNRVKTKDEDSGSFPHGGFTVEDDGVTIFHDGNRTKHEISLTVVQLTEIAKAAGFEWSLV
jgi:hypothetical protein